MDNLNDLQNIINVCWMSDGQRIGDSMFMSQDPNGNKFVYSDFTVQQGVCENAANQVHTNGTVWIGGAGNSSDPWIVPQTIGIGDPPYNTPTPWVPMPGPTYPGIGGGGGGTALPVPLPSIWPITPTPVEEKDEKGNRVVKSPPPSLELILVEIAKVLRDGGDILGVREIFEKHKLKLVDHDGEIIFDPRKPEELEDKGF